MSSSEMFDQGLRTRREVLGSGYVGRSLAQADDFMMALQRITAGGALPPPGASG